MPLPSCDLAHIPGVSLTFGDQTYPCDTEQIVMTRVRHNKLRRYYLS